MILTVNDQTILRTWKDEDAPHLFSLVDANRDILEPWLPWVPYVKEEKDSLQFIQTSSSDPHSGKGLELGIWHNGDLAGCIGLHDFSAEHKKTSFGYWLGKNFQGKGLMMASVQRLTQFCFEELKSHRVEIHAAVENRASRHIPERLGFIAEGTLREAELVKGRFLDIVVYSKLEGEIA